MIIISAILFALLLGVFMFLVLPRASGWQRAASTAIFVSLIGVVYAGSIESLSRPKPLRLEWRNPAKAKVLGAKIDEGKAIYVWLQVGNSPEPRSYALPWNMRMAEQLQSAMRQARAHGTGVEVDHPLAHGKAVRNATGGMRNLAGAAKFYAQPQPPAPPKSYGTDADPRFGGNG